MLPHKAAVMHSARAPTIIRASDRTAVQLYSKQCALWVIGW